MSVPVWYVVIALIVVWLTFLLLKSYHIKSKLKWLGVAPGWPLIGNVFDFMDSTNAFRAMHELILKHNGLCYAQLFLRPFILVSEYKFLEWVLSSKILIEKSNDYKAIKSWLDDGLLIAPGPEWRKGRKIINQTFHFKILEQFVDVFERPILKLINILEKEVGKESVDVYPIITQYALDGVCETMMGLQTNDLDETLKLEYFDAVSGMCRILMERITNPIKKIDALYYFTSDYLKEKKYVKVLHTVSNAIIEKRRNEIEKEMTEKAESKKNCDQPENEIGLKRKMAVLDFLLTLKDEDEQPLTHKFIREQVDTLMFGGYDTLASSNTFIAYCLADYADVQEKAVQEIREVLGGREKITYADLNEFKYLELVIKEVLRLYPTVPYFTRLVTEETLYDGDKIIPKGVTLVILAYTVNRDPKVYEEPDKFIPTRFLDTEIKQYSYIPFGAGPRNCVGHRFAMLNMKFTIAKLLLNFEFLPSEPEHKVILAAEMVLKSKNGVNIRLKKRGLPK